MTQNAHRPEDHYNSYKKAESEAVDVGPLGKLTFVSPYLLPGLVQTQHYGFGMFAREVGPLPAEQQAAFVGERLRRQSTILEAESPPWIEFYINRVAIESVHRITQLPVQQLLRLLEVANMPHVSLRAVENPVMAGPFYGVSALGKRLGFWGEVSGIGAFPLEQPHVVAKCEALLTAFAQVAMSEQATCDLIAQEMDRHTA